MVFVGCASWQLAKSVRDRFPGEGTLLARYARQLPATEVNSSFYRQHRQSQYAKWASETPNAFRFAVKLPRWLTHNQRLRDTTGLEDFLEETAGLGDKRGPLLVQLPPKLAFEPENVEAFLETLRHRFDGGVVCEPRHASWFDGRADQLLERFEVSRAGVDPAPCDGADQPGGWPGRVYVRLHGSPEKFYSAYTDDFLRSLADRLQGHARKVETWCIFNNTAAEGAFENSLALMGHLGQEAPA